MSQAVRPKPTFLPQTPPYCATATVNSGEIHLFPVSGAYGARYLDPKTSRWISADPAVSDYIPQTPTDDDARKHNQNLPGMGGVYNLVNLHVYHYAGNNPVKYTDPDGRLTLYFGVAANAGAGSGVAGSKGVYISIGKDGLKIGTYTSKSLGATFGASADAGIVIGVDKNDDISGQSLVIGGSGGEGLNVGGDVSISLEDGISGISVSIGIGGGSPGEGHILYTDTETQSADVGEVAKAIKEEIVRRVVDTLPPPEFWP